MRGSLHWWPLLTSLVVSSASGQEGPSLVNARLELDAAPSCSTARSLAARVARRSSRIRLVGSADASPRLLVSIRPSANKAISAELVVVSQQGTRSHRRLSAPSCAEAEDALALVIAITLDPASVDDAGSGSTEGAAREAEASSGARDGDGVSASAGEAGWIVSGASGGGNTRLDAAGAGGGAGASASAQGGGGPDLGADGREPVERTRFHARAGAAFAGIVGPAPRWMPGLSLELLVAWDRAPLWSPALRLSAARHWSSDWVAAGGTADFALEALSLDLCPVRLGTGVFTSRGCASASLGQLSARGTRTYSPQSRTRPFAVLGGAVLLAASLPFALDLNLSLAAGAPLVADEFAFEPDVFHRVPSVVASFACGVALRWP